MPHFVTKPTQASLKYYIFSTIVMGPITEKMYRKEMEEWLMSHEGHESFCDPRPVNKIPEILEHYDTPELRKLLDKDANKMYWNGSFWFVTEEDGWFV
jgi:hypothetical protein